MDNFFTFDGKSCLDFGIVATGTGTYNRPRRRVEHIEVPGRNGTLTVSDGTYENVTLWYDCYAFKNFTDKLDGLAAWLLSKPGYIRLEDTYHPDYFRLAEFAGPIEATPTTLMRSGRFRLEFNCRPEKHLRSGENYIKYMTNNDIEINNPTLFPAEPIFKMEGTVIDPWLDTYTLSVNNVRITTGLNSMGGKVAYKSLYLDCESWEAYNEEGESRNHIVTLEDKKFPKLLPGNNVITLKSYSDQKYASCDFSIKPRWWTL